MLTCDEAVFQQGAFRIHAGFSVSPGRTTAVIGPSGAGKSTLLHGIAGFVPQVQGALTWEGADLTTLAPERRPVAMLFQDNNLFPHLTVVQNVALALAPRLRPSPMLRLRLLPLHLFRALAPELGQPRRLREHAVGRHELPARRREHLPQPQGQPVEVLRQRAGPQVGREPLRPLRARGVLQDAQR